MSIRDLSIRVVLLGVTLLAMWSAPILDAQGTSSGPVVTLDRTVIDPGQRVVLNIDGFESMNVTISVCGNEARRGSVDCNMFASEGLKLDTDGTSTVIQIPVAAPPVPCPCVIRVSNRTFDEIAIAPITLLGHAVAPIVETPGRQGALAVTIAARNASPGLFAAARASMGGPATYEVTVTVKNTSTVPLAAVSLAGSVGRRNDQLAALAFDDPGVLAPGRSWQQVVTTKVPGPSFGALKWEVAASGAGPTVTAIGTTTQRPTLLIVIVLFLVADVFLLAIRFRIRRRQRAESEASTAPQVTETLAVV